MVHTVVWRVGSVEALDFWADRLGAEGHTVVREGETLRFADPEELLHELVVARVPDEPLVADHPEIPREVALQDFDGVRAYAHDPDLRTKPFVEAIGFEEIGEHAWETRDGGRGGWIAYEPAPEEAGIPARAPSTTWPGPRRWTTTRRGSVRPPRRAGGRRRSSTASGSARSTSASRAACSSRSRRSDPVSTTDEDPAHLGEKLILPPDFEHLRAQVEPLLTPLPNPRDWSLR